jgi:hypothetical protein
VTRTSTQTPTITRTPTPTSPLTGPKVSYIGAIDQNGCPFCCEFECRLTPTPTPFIDDLGRPVFLRSNGDFLLVVEAATGTSRRSPGQNLTPADGDRGDLQMLVSQDIGDGSSLICDIGPAPTPIGGVPGITDSTQFGPPFGSSQQVTDAMQDMECRFGKPQTSSDTACTHNSFGDFSYLGTGTVLQFCFQVPSSAMFHDNDTVVAVQLRDTSGNLGPRKDIVVRIQP